MKSTSLRDHQARLVYGAHESRGSTPDDPAPRKIVCLSNKEGETRNEGLTGILRLFIVLICVKIYFIYKNIMNELVM
ncbi:hypothetical protein [Paenibacillus sp. UASWS1643]|uniref:hypothetical protein n=1 Tax=Paenibacillus sp. UASWS1643 TaxID=2580422 RepID=UPI001238B5E7|nr:hypothetical protein [Paenibacillus sp. UASWS1643]KAA8745473.1 hypothetical protein FE296_26775 [Paenibacillus sp. UASWS1643]